MDERIDYARALTEAAEFLGRDRQIAGPAVETFEIRGDRLAASSWPFYPMPALDPAHG